MGFCLDWRRPEPTERLLTLSMSPPFIEKDSVAPSIASGVEKQAPCTGIWKRALGFHE